MCAPVSHMITRLGEGRTPALRARTHDFRRAFHGLDELFRRETIGRVARREPLESCYTARMGRFIAGLVVGIVLVLGAGYAFLTQGGLPVAATNAKPLPLERFLTSRALHTALIKEENTPSPLQPTEANLLAGARVYRANCEVCHSAPGQKAPSDIARGMFPRPPVLMPPRKGVTDDPVGETHWKVKNGIRLTGMPGFEGALSEDELWQVSLLLLHADKLPDPVKSALAPK